MTRDELQKKLTEYAAKIKEGTANTLDHSAVKNAIRETYDKGNLDKQTMADLGKAASHNFINRFSSKGLTDLPSKIIEKGGTVSKLEDLPSSPVKTAIKGTGKNLKSFAPLLGVLGKALPLAGVAAGMASGDLFAADPTGMLQSDEVGKGSDVIGEQPSFDFTPFRTNKTVNDSIPDTSNMKSFKKEELPQKQEKVRYSDLQKLLGK